MATVCPHCGNEIVDDDQLSYGERALTAIFGEIGNAEGFGRSLAAQWQEADGHRKYLFGIQIQKFIDIVDAHKQKDRHHKDVTAAQQLGALMEWSLQLMQTNDNYRAKMLAVIKDRELLPDLTDVIDAECVPVS